MLVDRITFYCIHVYKFLKIKKRIDLFDLRMTQNKHSYSLPDDA